MINRVFVAVNVPGRKTPRREFKDDDTQEADVWPTVTASSGCRPPTTD